jgi:hypothetical protein
MRATIQVIFIYVVNSDNFFLPSICYWGMCRVTFSFRHFWWCIYPLWWKDIWGASPTQVQRTCLYIDWWKFSWWNISDCTFQSCESLVVLSGMHESAFGFSWLCRCLQFSACRVLVVLSVLIITQVFSVAHTPDILGLKPRSAAPALVLASGWAVLWPWHWQFAVRTVSCLTVYRYLQFV